MYSSQQQQPPPDQPSTHSGGGGIAVMGRDMLSRPWGPFHICSLPPPVLSEQAVSVTAIFLWVGGGVHLRQLTWTLSMLMFVQLLMMF
ncbi:hypothetical protein KUCAC02_030495, partial [Chaenocephalus aceratus]